MDVVDPYAPPRADLELPPSAAAPQLWDLFAAGIWSVILSPVLGATLIWLNWRTIGDARRARGALLWLVSSVLVFVFPVAPDLGFMVIPLHLIVWPLYLIVWCFGSLRPQIRFVKKTWPEGYPRRSVLVPLLLYVVIAVLLFLAVLFLPDGSATAAGQGAQP